MTKSDFSHYKIVFAIITAKNFMIHLFDVMRVYLKCLSCQIAN